MLKNSNILTSFLVALFSSSSCKYVYLTSHGIAGTDRVYRLWAPYYYIGEKKIINAYSTIFYPIISLNYRDSYRHSDVIGSFGKSLTQKIIGKGRGMLAKLIRGWYFSSDIGQINDIDRLANIIRKYCKDDIQCIIQGVSRGASVIILTLALNPDLPIAAIILESPFDSIDSVLDGIVKKIGNLTLLKQNKYTFFTMIFQKHIPGLYKPIDYVNRVNKNIPILIICSLSDTLVPFQSSMRLYHALKKSGHTKTHIVILSKGKHGFLLQGDNKKSYEAAVHNFYKKYDLPYDPSKTDFLS